mmetsp:Transcript_54388/g.129611  ORF Transcript_54388/g.129611 Transcript_54388/m.129611 type:complete len:289 (-) Transcript_54388:38-904(-)
MCGQAATKAKLLDVDNISMNTASDSFLAVGLTRRLCFSLSIVFSDAVVYSLVLAPEIMASLRLELLIAFYASWVVVLFSMATLLTVDPAEQQGRADPSQDYTFCRHCRVDVPLNSRHCRHCGKCVPHFDHHCVWLNTCIGKRNYKAFISLITSLACMFLAVLVSVHAVTGDSDWAWFTLPRQQSLILLTAVAIPNAILLFFACGLCVLHAYLRFWRKCTMYQFLLDGRQTQAATEDGQGDEQGARCHLCECSCFQSSAVHCSTGLPMASQLSLLSHHGSSRQPSVASA